MKLAASPLAFILLATTVSIANADLTYTSQTRFVQTVNTETSTTNRIDAPDFSNFTESLGFASQDSSLGIAGIQASGTTMGMALPPLGSNSLTGTSHIEIEFSLGTTSEYMLSWDFTNNEFGRVVFNGGGISIDAPTGLTSNNAFDSYSSSGILAAGDYQMLVEISNGAATEGFTGTFDFDFQANSVPEPSAITLLLLAMLGLLRHRPNFA